MANDPTRPQIASHRLVRFMVKFLTINSMLVIIMTEIAPPIDWPVAADHVRKYRRKEMEEASADKSMAPRINIGAMNKTVD